MEEQGPQAFISWKAEEGVMTLKKTLKANYLKGKNHELNEDVLLQFIVTSYVGIVEWWITNGMPHPPQVMAEQVGILLERNL